jgi:hypothetical protein
LSFGFFLSPSVTADTNLVTTASWTIDGAVDPGPNPRDIMVSVDGKAAGTFSELKVYSTVASGVVAQVFSVKGNGMLQPALPPPGEVGGAFYLASYWDCAQGLVPPLAIVELNLKSKVGKNSPLQWRGKLSNSNSLESTSFSLKFYPPKTDSVQVDVRYRLVATRDFCVDATAADKPDTFRAVTMAANYISADAQDNDTLRYVRLLEKICLGFGICHTRSASFCAAFTNATGYVLAQSYRLGGQRLFLEHSQAVPRNTPTLAVFFQSPPRGRFKPQGFVTATDDPTAPNVSVWGNWSDAKTSYRAGKKLGQFRYSLEASTPKPLGCDRPQ